MRRYKLLNVVCAFIIVLWSSCEQKRTSKLITRDVQRNRPERKAASCCQSNLPSRFDAKIPTALQSEGKGTGPGSAKGTARIEGR